MESAPTVAAPDPTVTAAAQTASNVKTAETQAELNQVNQISPNGTSTYAQTGTNADGTPQYTQTTTLNPTEQGIFNTGLTSEQNLANTGAELTANAQKQLAQPFNVDQSVANKIDQLGKTQLDPQWAANDSKQAATLANEGITPGSEAYNNAMTSYNAAKNSAYNQLYLQGDSQAESEALANQNETLNQISALMSGSQVSNPTFQSTPQENVAGTDVAGITQNSYLDANQQAQQSVAANNAMMGGLFSLGGTLGGAGILKYSDERLKTDIEKVGELDNDLPVYSYRYRSGGPKEIGLLAQDVEKKNPDAVMGDKFGWKMVDYSKAVGAHG